MTRHPGELHHPDEPPAAPARRPPPPALRDLDEPVVAELLAAVGSGDVGALGALYDRTAPLVFGLLRGVLGAESAERATERVFLRIWHGAPAFDPARDSAGTLLLRAARPELVRRDRGAPDAERG